MTEIYDFLRLLFARLGRPYCPDCGIEISAQSVDRMTERVSELGDGEKVSIFSPIVQGRKGEYRKELEDLRREGFLKVRIDGKLRDLDEEIKLNKQKKHTIELLVDVIVIRTGVRDRINESLKLALKRSGGVAKAETGSGLVLSLSDKFACPECGMSYPEISPRLFSFNSPYGSCPTCQGLGETWFCDPELLIDEELSIDAGAIVPWRNSNYFGQLTGSVAEYYGIDTSIPFRKLSAKQKKLIIHGSNGEEITLKRERRGRTLRYKDTYAGVAGIITEW